MAVPIVIPLDVLELSMFNVVVLSNDILEPSTTNVPSISVLSKLVVPSTSKSVPTYNFLAILAPPSVRKAPVSPVASLESVVSVISTTPETVTVDVGLKFIILPDIVKSVPSPSIFSPSSPKVKPIFAGMLISPPEPTVMDKSVPSDSIFSAVAKVSPTPEGMLTTPVAVKFMLFPVMVKYVPSPSIF